jgi:hypothetical protein
MPETATNAHAEEAASGAPAKASSKPGTANEGGNADITASGAPNDSLTAAVAI